ncbi:YD repeat protein [Pseudomonas reidholzensis]|uniref:YD repeat protein n=1 Tax=Pseudomonas reidholzensis TaxID=1785162 RepID=A0A383S085_9PSED|nr:RHS repeat-associated core domain-containing protein [Pseudomonas reidholzensis]SYX92048.1 YD repeat protein [Pseudomonas reidholzensis]
MLEASAQRFCTTLEQAYNALGQKVTETHLDWLQTEEPMPLKSTFMFDDWGLPYSTLGPDGVTQYQVLNPLGTPEHRGPILRSWRQSAGTAPQISGMTETWLNLFEKPEQVRRLGADQSLSASRSFTYDGLGRCLSQTDERGNSTAFSYDAWGRMLTSTLPDNTLLERAYAAHSSADLPISLSVTPANTALPRQVVGTQAFDGLDQLTEVCTGGRCETYVYSPGQSRAAQKITAAGEVIDYTYQLSLTDEPTSSRVHDDNATFDYDPQSANLTYASNEKGSRQYDYNQANQLTAEHWTDPSGTCRSTLHASSLQDRLISRTDDLGKVTAHAYDAQGRLSITTQGQLKVTQTYDLLSRTRQTTTQDLSNKSTLVTTVDYDDHDQEIKRTLQLDNTPERVVVQSWLKDGLLERRTLSEAGTTLLDETFFYDTRGRLSRHACTGTELPKDALGREIASQVFRLDAYDNMTLTVTTFADRTTEQTRFTYTNAEDPCQLTGITYTPKRATPDPTFDYDANGNLLTDPQGRSLSYDSQGRLLAVHDSSGQALGQYQYDSHGELFGARLGAEDERLLMYEGDRLSLAIRGALRTEYLYQGSEPVAEQHSDAQSNTLLLQANASGSVIAESQQGALRSARFSAYGERTADPAMRGGLGFNGEMLDPASGCYLLGRGYRAYNPEIKRFHSPDSFSPFGSGGLNSYGYCLGNPITFRDPTGHSAIGWSGRLRAPDEDVIAGLGKGGGSGAMPWVYLGVAVIFTIISIGTAAGAIYTLSAEMAAASAVEAAVVGTAIAGAVSAAAVKAAVATTVATLSLAATISQGIAVGGSNETAGKVAEYLGYATAAVTIGAMARSVGRGVMSLVKRLAGRGPKVTPTNLAPTAGGGAGFRNPLANPTGSTAAPKSASLPVRPSKPLISKATPIVRKAASATAGIQSPFRAFLDQTQMSRQQSDIQQDHLRFRARG